MSESNGKATAARRVMSELGEGADLVAVNDRLRQAGNSGDCISKGTWYKLRRQLWPHLGYGKRGEDGEPAGEGEPVPVCEPSPFTLAPAPPADADWLSKLVRFGLAVEAVGGVAVARRWLDALEQIEAGVRRDG